jgi:hypothetical protein
MKCKKFVWLGLLAAGLFAFTACGDDDGGAGETNCADNLDNDGDGRIDCQDSDCFDAPACGGTGENNCSDGVDNDDDGFTDCLDSDCDNDPDCQGGGEIDCENSIDDDDDGFTDCEDMDCNNDPACDTTNETNCSNEVDDDGDGLTDCDDADCANDANCQGDVEICDNNVDDDNDSWVDCDDPDCANDANCQGGGELSCQGIGICYNCCTSGDSACYDACYNAGSTTAQGLDDAIYSCLETNCSGSDQCGSGATQEQCNACIEANCQSQVDACGWAPSGTATCSELGTCLSGCAAPNMDGTGNASTCPTDAGLTCYDECHGQADQDAIDKFWDYQGCYFDNCADTTACQTDPNGTECNQCVEDNCSTEGMACQND